MQSFFYFEFYLDISNIISSFVACLTKYYITMTKEVKKKSEDGYSINGRKTITNIKSALSSLPSLERHSLEEIIECEAICKELLTKLQEHKVKNKEKYLKELQERLAFVESI